MIEDNPTVWSKATPPQDDENNRKRILLERAIQDLKNVLQSGIEENSSDITSKRSVFDVLLAGRGVYSRFSNELLIQPMNFREDPVSAQIETLLSGAYESVSCLPASSEESEKAINYVKNELGRYRMKLQQLLERIAKRSSVT